MHADTGRRSAFICARPAAISLAVADESLARLNRALAFRAGAFYGRSHSPHFAPQIHASQRLSQARNKARACKDLQLLNDSGASRKNETSLLYLCESIVCRGRRRPGDRSVWRNRMNRSDGPSRDEGKLSGKDITPVLKGWDYEPGTINVRKINGVDGSSKLQMRVDLGLLQM